MESLFAIVAAFLFWRAALVTSLALVAAVLMIWQVSWFTGGHGLAVVVVAFGVGLLWESSARSQVGEQTAAVKISAPVATLGLAFFGAVAGASASAAAGSVVAGAIALVAAAAAVGIYTSRVEQRPFMWRSFVHSALSLLAGLGCIVILGALRA